MSPRNAVALFVVCAFVIAPGCVLLPSPPTPSGKRATETRVIGDFEAGQTQGWYGSDGAAVSVVDDHATSGKKSLRVELPAAPYPGIGLDLGGQDWSTYDALFASVYNASGSPVTLSLRIDDMDSRGYNTRFNLEGPPIGIRLAPGANELDVPIASLRQGTPESCGLDVERIKLVRFFVGGPKQPVTLFLDNVRLVHLGRTGPDALTLVDLDAGKPGKWAPSSAANVTLAPGPAGAPGQWLKVQDLPEGGDYPGVDFSDFAPGWQIYDLLDLDIFCPADVPTIKNISIKLVDGFGRTQTLSVALNPGMNKVAFPIELASFVGLSRITRLQLFAGKPSEKLTWYVSSVRLDRIDAVNRPTVHDPAAEADRLAIDFGPVNSIGRNTCYMVTAWIPLNGGAFAVVRCSSPAKAQASYGLPASAFADYAEGQIVHVWAEFLDHGVWSWGEVETTLKGAAPGKVTFTPEVFGR